MRLIWCVVERRGAHVWGHRREGREDRDARRPRTAMASFQDMEVCWKEVATTVVR